MTTLLDLRDRVRAQTQTTAGELGDSLLDWYLQQGFERTINAEVRWPFYEQAWDLTLQPNQFQIDLPGDVNAPGIITLFDIARGLRMEQKPQYDMEEAFVERPTWDGTQWVANATPISPQVWYSVWADKLTLWPITINTVERHFILRGYRKPIEWLTPANEPDCDPRLHLPLVHYAVALAYEQQEDESLNNVYMDRWQRDVELARSQIMDPRHHRPLVGAGSITSPNLGYQPFIVEPPSP